MAYDSQNSKMMGRDYQGHEGRDDFFPKDAKFMRLKACSSITKHFDYPDTQEAIYMDQEDQVRDASKDYAKADKR